MIILISSADADYVPTVSYTYRNVLRDWRGVMYARASILRQCCGTMGGATPAECGGVFGLPRCVMDQRQIEFRRQRRG